MTDRPDRRTGNSSQPFLIAVGGGKGGTGKSSIALNLGILLGKKGFRVDLVDMDFGGANLHTLMGITAREKRLIDYLYRDKGNRDLNSYCLETPFSSVRLLSGDGFRPGIANMEYGRKLRLLNALKRLDADCVVCDLGAGCAYNVVDFFCAAHQGLVVMTLEATGVLNGYEFLKNCVFRQFQRVLPRNSSFSELLDRYRDKSEGVSGDIPDLIEDCRIEDPEIAEEMTRICRQFQPGLLFNMSRGSKSFLNGQLTHLSRKHLGIEAGCWAVLPREETVSEAANRRHPFVLENPDSPCTQEIERMVDDHLLPRMKGVNTNGKDPSSNR